MRLLRLLTSAALASATIYLQPEKRSIVGRGLTSWGGVALLETPCPSGTSTCGKASCCPTGYTCNNSNSGQPLCCPTSADCSTTVQALNACADQSWELYAFGGMFCCTSDYVGTFSSAGTQCIARSLPIPSSISLTTVTQVTGTATAGVVASGTKSAGAGLTTNIGSSTGTGAATSGTGSTSGSNSGSSGSTSGSSKSSLPQAAIIAIAILATIVAMLALFILWRFNNRKKTRQAQTVAAAASQPMISAQGSNAAFSPVPVFKGPESRVGELSGTSAPGPIYETGMGQHIELDADNRRM